MSSEQEARRRRNIRRWTISSTPRLSRCSNSDRRLLSRTIRRSGIWSRRREDIDNKIDALKYQKSLLAPDDYKRQLTALLIELAKVQEAIDK